MNIKILHKRISTLLLTAILIPNFGFGQSNYSVNAVEKNSETSHSEMSNLPRFIRDLSGDVRFTQIESDSQYQTEADELIETLGRESKKNVVLVNRTALRFDILMNEFTRRLTAADVPSNLRGKKLWSLNLTQLLAENSEISKAVYTLQETLAEAEKAGVILAVEDIANNAGKLPYNAEISEILRKSAVSGKVRFVSSSTIDEFEMQISADEQISKWFAKVEVKSEDERYKFVGDKIAPDLQEMLQNAEANQTVEIILQGNDLKNRKLHNFLTENNVRIVSEFKDFGAMTIELPVSLVESLSNIRAAQHLSLNKEVGSSVSDLYETIGMVNAQAAELTSSELYSLMSGNSTFQKLHR